MAQLRIDFQGRGKAKTFPWAGVEPMGDGIQLSLGITREVRPLGQVLAQQPIGILVGAPLPWGVRIRKEDLNREPLGQARVLGHFFATIVRQGFPQQGGDMPEFRAEPLSGTPGIRPLHPGQEDQAGRPLHQCANRRSIAGALEKIAFPVARHRASDHFSGACGDGRHVGNLATAVYTSCPRSTGLASLTQRRQQLTSQGASRHHIQTGINGFGREVFSHIARIRASDATSNLFWRAARRQLHLNMLPQPRVKEFPCPSWILRSGGGVTRRRTGSVWTAACRVSGDLATQGAWGPSQDLRHCSERMAMSQAQTQGLTVFSTQVCVAFC